MEKDKGNQSVKRAAIAILQYLRDHPRAKDNAKGIAQWWIGEDQSVVEKALSLLKERGVIEKRGDLFKLVVDEPKKQSEEQVERVLRRLQMNE